MSDPVSELPVVVVASDVLVSVAFGATGAVAATALVNAAVFAGAAPACVAGWFTDAAPAAAAAAVFAVTDTDAVVAAVVVVAADAVSVAAAVSVLT